MSWIVITIIAYLLLAAVNIGDKFLLDNGLDSPKFYAFLISLLSGLVIVIAPWFLKDPGAYWIFVNLLTGALFPWALYFMFAALKRGDASKITVLIGGIIPIFTLLFSILFWHENFAGNQWLGIVLLLIGTFIIALAADNKKKQVKIIGSSAFYLAVASALVYALFFLMTKYAYNNQDFVSSFIWIRLGGVLMALLFLVPKKWRLEIISSFGGGSQKQKNSLGKRAFVLFNQAMGALGSILQNYAISFGSVAVINALQGVQYAFLLLGAWALTIFYPKILKENISRAVILKKLIAIILISIGLYFLVI